MSLSPADLAVWVITAYCAAAVVIILGPRALRPGRFRLELVLIAAGLVLHTVLFAGGYLAAGNGTFSDSVRFAVSVGWFLVIAGIWLLRDREQTGAAAVALVFGSSMLALGAFSWVADTTNTSDFWLELQGLAGAMACAGFGVAAAVAVVFLAHTRLIREHGLSTVGLRQQVLSRNAVVSGIILHTVALGAGAGHASNWGSWWSWQPAETGALLTWLVYFLYLHMWNERGTRGRLTAWMAVVGFGLALCTYLGASRGII